jgi:chromosome segregation ATPase
MISKVYIDAAIQIRDEFIDTQNKLGIYEKELSNISSKIEKNIKSLLSLKEDILSTSSGLNKEEVNKKILEEMEIIEGEGNKYSKLITPLSDKIEELHKREDALYNDIKERYPKLSDDDIITELRKYIKK